MNQINITIRPKIKKTNNAAQDDGHHGVAETVKSQQNYVKTTYLD